MRQNRMPCWLLFTVLSVLSLGSSSMAQSSTNPSGRDWYYYCAAFSFVTVHPNYYSDVFHAGRVSFRVLSEAWGSYLVNKEGFTKTSDGGFERDFHDRWAKENYNLRCAFGSTEKEAKDKKDEAQKGQIKAGNKNDPVETGWAYGDQSSDE
jgi:hypothetical protein